MQKELLSHTNPNYLHGCYPLDLGDYFGESPFSLIFRDCRKSPKITILAISQLIKSITYKHQNYRFRVFRQSLKNPQTPSQQISARLSLLKRVLSSIYASDFASKDYFAQYMRHKYRRNCQPNTLRQAATSLTQFLAFYRDTGKQHLEQMSREDIEAFIEYQQDRGLK